MKKIITITAFALLTGCATAPENITPTYVSGLQYQSLDCAQLGAEQARLISALTGASDAQRQARSNDTVGVIFLGLPVSSLSGSNQAGYIGSLKGQLVAIQQVSIQKSCGLPQVELGAKPK